MALGRNLAEEGQQLIDDRTKKVAELQQQLAKARASGEDTRHLEEEIDWQRRRIRGIQRAIDWATR